MSETARPPMLAFVFVLEGPPVAVLVGHEDGDLVRLADWLREIGVDDAVHEILAARRAYRERTRD